MSAPVGGPSFELASRGLRPARRSARRLSTASSRSLSSTSHAWSLASRAPWSCSSSLATRRSRSSLATRRSRSRRRSSASAASARARSAASCVAIVKPAGSTAAATRWRRPCAEEGIAKASGAVGEPPPAQPKSSDTFAPDGDAFAAPSDARRKRRTSARRRRTSLRRTDPSSSAPPPTWASAWRSRRRGSYPIRSGRSLQSSGARGATSAASLAMSIAARAPRSSVSASSASRSSSVGATRTLRGCGRVRSWRTVEASCTISRVDGSCHSEALARQRQVVRQSPASARQRSCVRGWPRAAIAAEASLSDPPVSDGRPRRLATVRSALRPLATAWASAFAAR